MCHVWASLREKDRHTGAFMCEACFCIRVCMSSWVFAVCMPMRVLRGKGSGGCAEFKENQFNSGLF